MPDWLSFKDLNPSWIGVVGSYFIIHMVLSFISKMRMNKTVEKVSTHDAALVETLGLINKSIQEQTLLTREQTGITQEVAVSLRKLSHEVGNLRVDLDLVSGDVKEIKAKQKVGGLSSSKRENKDG